MTGAPLTYTWTDDGSFKPLPHQAREADKRFVVGERYRMEEIEERSKVSHDQQFAWIGEAWQTLPERYRFEPWAQSEVHLRKYALIRTGFCTTEQFPCASRAEALRLAAILRSDDQYCLVTITGSIVNRFRAESQRTRGPNRMDKRRFQQSKQAVFDFIGELLDVDPETWRREVGPKAGLTRAASPPTAPTAPVEREKEGVS